MDGSDENLTRDEREDMAENQGETGEEARDQERYDANAERLDRIESMLADLAEAVSGIEDRIGAIASVSIDNGEDVTDEEDDATVDVEGDTVEIPDFEDMDLSIK